MTASNKTWFITGTSRGFGRQWTEAALERGDRVAATARNVASLGELVSRYGDKILPLALDVTDRNAAFAAVKAAKEHFGVIDVVVNNAGYGLFGAVEEVSEAQARAQLETNVFGALWVTQAALPYLRAQGHGHIIQTSSIGGIGAFPLLGIYHASKWALEGFSESLSQEVASFGIKVTMVEPGGFNTDWGGSSSTHSTPMAAYQPLRDAQAAQAAGGGIKIGDPKASSRAILALVDSPNPPLRLLLGSFAVMMAPMVYQQRLKTWKEWEELSKASE
jgi:NAD(P)-dependent dehydrogenase (short-subunit alcohol dehydrogenase family)